MKLAYLLLLALALATTSSHADVNAWVSLQPTGAANALGGNLITALHDDDGAAFATTQNFEVISRAATADSWSPYQAYIDGQPAQFMLSFQAHPGAAQVITAWGRVGGQNVIVRSSDGGASWTSLYTFAIFEIFSGFAVAPSDVDIVYAFFGADELRKTVDGGSDWETIAVNAPSYPSAINVDPFDPLTLYAISDGEFLKSTDGGVNWVAPPSGLPPTLDYLNALALDSNTSGTLYVGSGNTGRIFKTADGGASWQMIGLPVSLNRGPIDALAVDPTNSDLVYALTGGGPNPTLYRSTDAGVSWALVPDPDVMARYGGLTFSAGGDLLFYGSTGAGLIDAGGALRASNQGYSGFSFSGIRIAPGNSERMFGLSPSSGVVATDPAPPLWEVRRTGMGPDARDLDIDPANPDHLLATSLFGLFETYDAGRTWQPRVGPGPDTATYGEVKMAPGDAQQLYLRASSGLYASNDGGTSWTQGLSDADFPAGGVYGPLAVSLADDAVAYVGTAQSGLLETGDAGATWQQGAGPFSQLQVVDIATDPSAPGDLYLATRNDVWYRQDATDVWVQISDSQFADSRIKSIALDARVAGRVFVYHDRDFWARDPRNGSWTLITPMPSVAGGFSTSYDLFSADPNRSGRVLFTLSELFEYQLDSDLDGIADYQDNCIMVANAGQLDGDGDDIGNACDLDIAPALNDCAVTAQDLAAFKLAFASTPGDINWNPAADFSGDLKVNVIDLGRLRAGFFGVPGPSAIGNACR